MTQGVIGSDRAVSIAVAVSAGPAAVTMELIEHGTPEEHVLFDDDGAPEKVLLAVTRSQDGVHEEIECSRLKVPPTK